MDLERKEPEMARGKRFSPEQIIAMLRQIEVQRAQGKSLALACKEAGIAEQSRDRRVARPRQSCAASLSPGLPATRAGDSRRRQSPPVQERRHALTSQSARPKIP